MEDILIELRADHVKGETSNQIGSDYTNPFDCPLMRAIREQAPLIVFDAVGGGIVWNGTKGKDRVPVYKICPDYNFNNLVELKIGGKPLPITLTPIKPHKAAA